MIPNSYIVIFEDGTTSEEFAYSPAEACQQAVIIWSQSNQDQEPPKITSIRPADHAGLQKLQGQAVAAMIKNVRNQLSELLK